MPALPSFIIDRIWCQFTTLITPAHCGTYPQPLKLTPSTIRPISLARTAKVESYCAVGWVFTESSGMRWVRAHGSAASDGVLWLRYLIDVASAGT